MRHVLEHILVCIEIFFQEGALKVQSCHDKIEELSIPSPLSTVGILSKNTGQVSIEVSKNITKEQQERETK